MSVIKHCAPNRWNWLVHKTRIGRRPGPFTISLNDLLGEFVFLVIAHLVSRVLEFRERLLLSGGTVRTAFSLKLQLLPRYSHVHPRDSLGCSLGLPGHILKVKEQVEQLWLDFGHLPPWPCPQGHPLRAWSPQRWELVHPRRWATLISGDALERLAGRETVVPAVVTGAGVHPNNLPS